MRHVDESEIELYLLEAPEIDHHRRLEIGDHLRECPECLEIYDGLKKYYSEFQHSLDTARAIVVAERRPVVVSEALPDERWYPDRPPQRGSLELAVPVRIARWMVRHPVVSTSAGFGTVFLASFLMLQPAKISLKDTNPSYARAEKEFLKVYNKDGDVVWKKHIGIGYDLDETLRGSSKTIDDFIETADVDGDGKNEVVAIFGWNPKLPIHNTIMCYNADSTEKWIYTFHRQIKFGGQEYHDDYVIGAMIVGDFDRDGRTEVVAIANHLPDFPSATIELDAASGDLLAEFWHAGQIGVMNHVDLEGDGIEEIMLGTENNGLNQAALIVLDPRNMTGHAPAPPAYIPNGIPEGTEKYYIVFPRLEIKDFSIRGRNQVGEVLAHGDKHIQVSVGEQVTGGEWQGVSFIFDHSMRCAHVEYSDYYVEYYKKLMAEGKLNHPLDTSGDELIKGIRYWDGEKFVSEPTMNKRYLQAIAQK